MTDRIASGAPGSPVELALLIAALDRLSETLDLVRSELVPGVDTRSARPRASQPPHDPGALVTLRADGEYWTIGGEHPFHLRDSLGLRYLARLVSEPRREIHVLDLAVAGGPAPPDAAEARAARRAHPEDALVDATARAAYRTRLTELEAERGALLDDLLPEPAASAGLEAIDAEIDALRAELARAYGLGGRARRWVSETERARQRISKAIRAAVERIELNDASLGSHLRHSVRTGMYCSYDPDPGSAVRWQL